MLDSAMNISNMIAQYNANQPDFGEKIDDPHPRRAIRGKNKTKLFRGVASGHNVISNNRNKLEEDRRQMLQYNLGGSEHHPNEEEKKMVARKPPRGASGRKKLRHKPNSIRSNNVNRSGIRDSSFMSSNAANTSYSKRNHSNRITPPWPVRIPKEVTDGISMLREMRHAREGKTNDTTYMSSHVEESKSPGSFVSSNNVSYFSNNPPKVLEKSQVRTRPKSGIRIK